MDRSQTYSHLVDGIAQMFTLFTQLPLVLISVERRPRFSTKQDLSLPLVHELNELHQKCSKESRFEFHLCEAFQGTILKPFFNVGSKKRRQVFDGFLPFRQTLWWLDDDVIRTAPKSLDKRRDDDDNDDVDVDDGDKGDDDNDDVKQIVDAVQTVSNYDEFFSTAINLLSTEN